MSVVTSSPPYITAGIGAARVEFEMTDSPDYDDTVFAYQVGIGAGFAVSETVTLDCRYRYLGAEDAEFSYQLGDLEVEMASHNITLGLRMAFALFHLITVFPLEN